MRCASPWLSLSSSDDWRKDATAQRRSAKLMTSPLLGDGHGPGEPAQRWAAAKGLTEDIQFSGKVTYATLMGRPSDEADVLVRPSIEESFSMAAAEAMALGLPVVAGRDSGGITQVVEPGTGILVNLRSPAEVAEAIITLARDRTQCEALGRAARRTALARFEVDRVFEQYERVYESLLPS